MCTRVEQLIPNVRRLGMQRLGRFLTGGAKARSFFGGDGKEIKNGEHAETRMGEKAGARAGLGRAERKERGANVAGPASERGPGERRAR